MTNNNQCILGAILFEDPKCYVVASNSAPSSIALVWGDDWRSKPRLEVHNRTSDTPGHVTAILGPVSYSSSLSLFGSPLGAARRVLELAQVDEPVSLPKLFAEMGLT